MPCNSAPWAKNKLPITIVLASRNRHKIREYARLLPAADIQLLGLDDIAFHQPLTEPGSDYITNARSKAEAVAAQTEHDVFADDSGIEVLALQGWPGANSARWLGDEKSDEERTLALWEKVQSLADKRARYVCVIALARAGGETEIFQGTCNGVLVAPQKGGRGFGYDPIFYSRDLGMTFAQAADAQKDAVSHRRRAVTAMLQALL